MLTAKQEELLVELGSRMSAEEQALYRPLMDYLLELGYRPRLKKKRTFLVEFVQFGKIMAKLEIDGKLEPNAPEETIFSLRCSASEDFPEVVLSGLRIRPAAWTKRGQLHPSVEQWRCCGYCKGEVRIYRFPDEEGQTRCRCGLYSVPVPNMSHADLPSIRQLIDSQHAFFIRNATTDA